VASVVVVAPDGSAVGAGALVVELVLVVTGVGSVMVGIVVGLTVVLLVDVVDVGDVVEVDVVVDVDDVVEVSDVDDVGMVVPVVVLDIAVVLDVAGVVAPATWIWNTLLFWYPVIEGSSTSTFQMPAGADSTSTQACP
jgi:hypothetical protein